MIKGVSFMQQDCLFCKIIQGEIPSYTIYEDDKFKVILDRFPVAPGHTLIISKQHHVDIFDMPIDLAKEIYPLAQKIAPILKEVTGADGINIVQNNGEAAGQAVFHFHLHLVPRKQGDGVKLNDAVQHDMDLDELQNLCTRLNKQINN